MGEKFLDRQKTIELIKLIKIKDYENFLILFSFFYKVVPNFYIFMKKISKEDKEKILNLIIGINEPQNQKLVQLLETDGFYEKIGIDFKVFFDKSL